MADRKRPIDLGSSDEWAPPQEPAGMERRQILQTSLGIATAIGLPLLGGSKVSRPNYAKGLWDAIERGDVEESFAAAEKYLRNGGLLPGGSYFENHSMYPQLDENPLVNWLYKVVIRPIGSVHIPHPRGLGVSVEVSIPSPDAMRAALLIKEHYAGPQPNGKLLAGQVALVHASTIPRIQGRGGHAARTDSIDEAFAFAIVELKETGVTGAADLADAYTGRFENMARNLGLANPFLGTRLLTYRDKQRLHSYAGNAIAAANLAADARPRRPLAMWHRAEIATKIAVAYPQDLFARSRAVNFWDDFAASPDPDALGSGTHGHPSTTRRIANTEIAYTHLRCRDYQGALAALPLSDAMDSRAFSILINAHLLASVTGNGQISRSHATQALELVHQFEKRQINDKRGPSPSYNIPASSFIPPAEEVAAFVDSLDRGKVKPWPTFEADRGRRVDIGPTR